MIPTTIRLIDDWFRICVGSRPLRGRYDTPEEAQRAAHRIALMEANR